MADRICNTRGGKKDKEPFLYSHDILSAYLGEGRTNKKILKN